jgi:rhodanese-related sulfurtransferase
MSGEPPFEISVEELAGRTDPVSVLDVREPWEREICALEGSIAVPLPELPQRVSELPRQGMLVVLCHHGVRSAHAARWLRASGFANAVNLAGGIDAWARRIDPTMGTY